MRLGTRSDIDVGQPALDRRQHLQQPLGRQLARVVVDLQRADAGGEIDDPGQRAGLQRLHQGMGPQAQAQIQRQRAVLHQQVVVAVAPVDHGDGRLARAQGGQDGRFGQT